MCACVSDFIFRSFVCKGSYFYIIITALCIVIAIPINQTVNLGAYFLYHRYSKGNVQKPGKCFSRPTANVLVHKSEDILNHREICLYVTTNSSLISFNQVL